MHHLTQQLECNPAGPIALGWLPLDLVNSICLVTCYPKRFRRQRYSVYRSQLHGIGGPSGEMNREAQILLSFPGCRSKVAVAIDTDTRARGLSVLSPLPTSSSPNQHKCINIRSLEQTLMISAT